MSILKNILDKHDLRIRIVFFVLMVGLSVLFLMVGTKAALAVGIKKNSVISGEAITLGDIFYNLPEGADKVLGPAPQPGHDMTLNARTLLRIAIAMDLPWRPSDAGDYVVLRRAATIIDQDVIEERLEEELREKGLTEDSFNLMYNGAPPQLILPPEEQPSFEIENVSYDPQREWFSATVLAPSSANPIQRIEVAGQVERMVRLPVMRDNLRNGTIIGKRDIDFIEVRQRDLNPDFILDAEKLAGMTPRRMLLAGKPVRATEIEAPQIVGRGDYVTMVFQEGPLSLTAKGRALENGAKGDVIRVVNASSNRSVEAVVTGEQEVTVQSY